MTRATLSAIFTAAVIVVGGPQGAPTTATAVSGGVAFTAVRCPGRIVRDGVSHPCTAMPRLYWPAPAPEVRVLEVVLDASGSGPLWRCPKCNSLLEIRTR